MNVVVEVKLIVFYRMRMNTDVFVGWKMETKNVSWDFIQNVSQQNMNVYVFLKGQKHAFKMKEYVLVIVVMTIKKIVSLNFTYVFVLIIRKNNVTLNFINTFVYVNLNCIRKKYAWFVDNFSYRCLTKNVKKIEERKGKEKRQE